MLLPLALIVALGSFSAGSPSFDDPCPEEDITRCDQLGGNSGCGVGFNCVHSASVECGTLVATVTYDTTCEMPPPQGGTASTTTVKAVLKTDGRCDEPLQLQVDAVPRSDLGRNLLPR